MLKPAFKRDATRHQTAFRNALVKWFEREGKDYPWRRTREAYPILVSEVMLQQTQIATVLGRGYYTRFLEAFPDLQSLAEAGDDELLKAWEGLGYYRRVRMLRETARAVIERHGGVFPGELEELLALPGVGKYTAGALRSFSFGLPSALVDGNVSRVLSRILDYSGPVDDTAGVKKIWEMAEHLADPKRPGAYNSALMELGQRICRPGVPDCLSCPVCEFCQTREPESLPVKKQKTVITQTEEHAVYYLDGKGCLLMHREGAKRREGLWKLPTREVAQVEGLPLLTEHRYTITRYRVTLRVYGVKRKNSIEKRSDEEWIPLEKVTDLAMPSPFRVVIARMLDEM